MQPSDGTLVHLSCELVSRWVPHYFTSGQSPLYTTLPVHLRFRIASLVAAEDVATALRILFYVDDKSSADVGIPAFAGASECALARAILNVRQGGARSIPWFPVPKCGEPFVPALRRAASASLEALLSRAPHSPAASCLDCALGLKALGDFADCCRFGVYELLLQRGLWRGEAAKPRCLLLAFCNESRCRSFCAACAGKRLREEELIVSHVIPLHEEHVAALCRTLEVASGLAIVDGPSSPRGKEENTLQGCSGSESPRLTHPSNSPSNLRRFTLCTVVVRASMFHVLSSIFQLPLLESVELQNVELDLVGCSEPSSLPLPKGSSLRFLSMLDSPQWAVAWALAFVGADASAAEYPLQLAGLELGNLPLGLSIAVAAKAQVVLPSLRVLSLRDVGQCRDIDDTLQVAPIFSSSPLDELHFTDWSRGCSRVLSDAMGGMCSCHSLRVLDLAGSYVGLLGARLAAILEELPSIEDVSLSGIPMIHVLTVDAVGLADALASCKPLRRLCWDGNRAGDAACYYVAKVLQRRRARSVAPLLELSLSNCGASELGTAILSAVWQTAASDTLLLSELEEDVVLPSGRSSLEQSVWNVVVRALPFLCEDEEDDLSPRNERKKRSRGEVGPAAVDGPQHQRQRLPTVTVFFGGTPRASTLTLKSLRCRPNTPQFRVAAKYAESLAQHSCFSIVDISPHWEKADVEC